MATARSSGNIQRRVAVILNNGRSHVLALPAGITAEEAAAVLVGEPHDADVSWPAEGAEWLRLQFGTGWVHRGAIAEIQVVDYADDYDLPYAGE